MDVMSKNAGIGFMVLLTNKTTNCHFWTILDFFSNLMNKKKNNRMFYVCLGFCLLPIKLHDSWKQKTVCTGILCFLWVGGYFKLVLSVSIITSNRFQHVHTLHICSHQQWKSSTFLFKITPLQLAHRHLKKLLFIASNTNMLLTPGTWMAVYRGSGNNVSYTSCL